MKIGRDRLVASVLVCSGLLINAKTLGIATDDSWGSARDCVHLLDLLLVVSGVWMGLSGKSFAVLLQRSTLFQFFLLFNLSSLHALSCYVLAGTLPVPRTLLVLGILVVFVAIFMNLVVKRSRSKGVERLALAIFSLLFLFLLGESVLIWVAKTNGRGRPLVAQRWQQLYWNPINRFGYRAKEYSQEDLDTKTKIFAIGDSFTAGSGIKSIDDRFSNQLQDRLPENFLVVNLGVTGSETPEQFEDLIEFPFEPDILILSHYINDIRLSAEKFDVKFSLPSNFDRMHPLLRFMVMHSHFLNFFYFEALISGDPFLPMLKRIYGNHDVLDDHRANLSKFVRYAEKRAIPLIAVVFPLLTDLEESNFVVEPIIELFESHHVPVLDVRPLVIDLSVLERIVNRRDAHPSIEVHHRVGAELASMMAAHKLLESPESRGE